MVIYGGTRRVETDPTYYTLFHEKRIAIRFDDTKRCERKEKKRKVHTEKSTKTQVKMK